MPALERTLAVAAARRRAAGAAVRFFTELRNDDDKRWIDAARRRALTCADECRVVSFEVVDGGNPSDVFTQFLDTDVLLASTSVFSSGAASLRATQWPSNPLLSVVPRLGGPLRRAPLPANCTRAQPVATLGYALAFNEARRAVSVFSSDIDACLDAALHVVVVDETRRHRRLAETRVGDVSLLRQCSACLEQHE